MNSAPIVPNFERVIFMRGVKRILVTLLCATAICCVHAQTNTPKYSNEFLAIGIDARALGLANAYTSMATDVSAGYWNPAGLLGLSSQYEAGFMHAEYFAGIANYDFAGFATRLDTTSAIAFSVIRFGIDDIPDTRFLYDANGAINYDNIRFFSAADYGFFFSYAKKLGILDGLDVGGSVKIIHRSAGNFATAWGYGIDLGAKKRFNSLTFGLMLKDITGTYNTWYHNSELVADIYTQTGNVIPENSLEITLPKATLGASYSLTFFQTLSLLASIDLEATFDGQRNTSVSSELISIDPRFGVEIGYDNKYFVRGGINQFQQIQNFDRSYSTIYQPNFGIGLVVRQLKIDYALTDIGDQTESPYSHVLSIKMSFDGK